MEWQEWSSLCDTTNDRNCPIKSGLSLIDCAVIGITHKQWTQLMYHFKAEHLSFWTMIKVKTQSLKYRQMESSFLNLVVEFAGIGSPKNVSFWHIWFVTYPHSEYHTFDKNWPIVMNEMSLERCTHGLSRDMKLFVRSLCNFMFVIFLWWNRLSHNLIQGESTHQAY